MEKRWFGENDSLGFSFKERSLDPKISWLLLKKLSGNKICVGNLFVKAIIVEEGFGREKNNSHAF